MSPPTVEPQSTPSGSPHKAPLSPRRRRLRWTVGVLSGLAVLGVLAGWALHLQLRPRQYRPDEESADITSSLARALPPEAPKPGFTDVTRSAGLSAFRTFVGDRTSQLPEDMGPGIAWGDFDNDGDEDLFLVSAGGPLGAPPDKLAACALYENLGNGTFREVETFPAIRIHGMGAAWGDYDGDGYLDLIVTGYNTLLLFHNEHGSGRFTRDARFPDLKGFWAGAAWGDYDNDRALDLYVCGYVQYVEEDAHRDQISNQIGTAVPYTLNPSSYPPGTNLLFHNLGDGTFAEVGAVLKVRNPEGRSLGAVWHDFDEDGWLDLYVANDVSDNVLYHNLGGKFEDLSHPALVADYRSAMGLAVGDFDRDGDDDLFIAHWVGQENALYQNLWADFNANPAAAKSSAGTNAMTGSRGPVAAASRPYPLRFMDIADMKGLGQIAIPYVGWGTEFVDVDGDGWLDLVVANGSTLEEEGPRPRKLKPQELFLFWNRRGEFFHNLAPLNRALAEPHVSRGLGVADYNNDGAADFLVTDLGEGVRLFRNDMQTGHWLQVRLRSLNRSGAVSGFGEGSKVIAHAGGVSLRRSVTGVSYLSQNSRTLHFGLGQATHIDALEVRWHAGATNSFTNLQADAVWEITEGGPAPRRLESRNPKAGLANPQAALPSAVPAQADKVRLLEFWNKQRAAMNAMKVEKDNTKAIALFREALALDPRHEDSRYYLGHCLASQGDVRGALEQLEELTRLNPQSHRAWQQWGTLRALFAQEPADLAAAEQRLEKARALNPEETGTLLVLGEIALLRGDPVGAETRLAAVCRTNPRAVGGFFLRGYMAWKRGDDSRAKQLLEETRTALGKDWQPKGATAEGDVHRKQHVEATPLTRFWESWNGATNPANAFATLDAFLTGGRWAPPANDSSRREGGPTSP